MKHAYLIIVHHQFELLELLLKCLDNPNNDFYIHIDSKVKNFDRDAIVKDVKYSSVTFTESISVHWGAFSQIKSELILLKAALKGNYDYFHLLSGVDLPIRSAQEILSFFENNKGKEFIHFCSDEYNKSENVQGRVKYHYFLQEKVGRNDGILQLISKITLKVQKILKVNRIKNKDFQIVCGANWFSITKELAKFVIDNEDFIVKLCKNGFCVDEIFLQTLVWNSAFKEKLYCPDAQDDYRTCLRFIDWKRGNPYTFTEQDFHELINSGFLFARKFDIEKHPEICYKIADYVLNR